ncbi:MAG: DUF4249 domain-containing protein [Cytophagales bacterium]|nr:DUF4249 domain-containing protein [Cytophagales bacterium]
MDKLFRSALLFVILISCVEQYEFKIKNEEPALVVEGYISNVSYEASKLFPADGRYFKVRLSMTSDVANVRDKKVKHAHVYLISSDGSRWEYTESSENEGEYMLCDDNFSAKKNILYKLGVILDDGESYESGWEQIPEIVPGEMGDIRFEETELEKYIYRNGEKVLTSFKGVNVTVDLPSSNSGNTIYYKWDFFPTWIYKSPLISIHRSDYKCWIEDPFYLSDYVLQKDNAGLYPKKLFFLETVGNERIYGRFSVLIRQMALSKGYFTYFEEIEDQGNRGKLFDPPPYNLETNLTSTHPDKKVFGYFGVVDEQAKRWYFDRLDVSYPVENRWKADCSLKVLAQPPKCYSCLSYENGIPTNIEPDWWEDE